MAKRKILSPVLDEHGISPLEGKPEGKPKARWCIATTGQMVTLERLQKGYLRFFEKGGVLYHPDRCISEESMRNGSSSLPAVLDKRGASRLARRPEGKPGAEWCSEACGRLYILLKLVNGYLSFNVEGQIVLYHPSFFTPVSKSVKA